MKHPGIYLSISNYAQSEYGKIPYWKGFDWRTRNKGYAIPTNEFDDTCLCDVYHSLEECKEKRKLLQCKT
jgi:hypothetical protein